MPRIIAKDNFLKRSEFTSDVLVADHVPDRYAKFIVEALNERYSGNKADKYFIAMPDGYRLCIVED